MQPAAEPLQAAAPRRGDAAFVDWFRRSSPYIHAHRGRTFVVLFGGEAVAAAGFAHLVHDLALLNALGIRLVLAHGARPQIEERLAVRGATLRYAQGLRVTDAVALAAVKDAVGSVRSDIEALLSMGVANSPMAGARIHVAAGNFITARPLGVREGVDFEHTGEVRRIDTATLQQRLDQGAIVLLPPLGYSPTGEIFNLSAEDVATATAAALRADKLICLTEAAGVLDGSGKLQAQIDPERTQTLLCDGPAEQKALLAGALLALKAGVRRVHVLSHRVDGALLQELFTRDGIGTLITAEAYEEIRPARIDDVGGILELIAPLEEQGTLVRRSRERLEAEIERFFVSERDGMVIGCAALYPFAQEQAGELACLAVHPDYRRTGRGDALLGCIEQQAQQQCLSRLFVLTTQAAHWFLERGFVPAPPDALPVARQALYNYRRNSRILTKLLA